MKFTTAILSIAGLAAAAPAPVPVFPNPGAYIAPSALSQYAVWTGAITYNTGKGKISKTQVSSDISTLLTFPFTSAHAGKTCTFHLYLDGGATISGSKQFDVFSSLYPATHSTTTWPPGNGRDNYYGRLSAVANGEATVVSGFNSPSFPCPTTTKGFEVVATDDKGNIEWTQSSFQGAYISY